MEDVEHLRQLAQSAQLALPGGFGGVLRAEEAQHPRRAQIERLECRFSAHQRTPQGVGLPVDACRQFCDRLERQVNQFVERLMRTRLDGIPLVNGE